MPDKTITLTKREWVEQQTFEASRSRWVTDRRGLRIPLHTMYRCLYCGEYFAQPQAEEHFGQRREDYTHNGSPDDVVTITINTVVEEAQSSCSHDK